MNMKQIIKHYTAMASLLAFGLILGACYGIDETQKEWTSKGEKIYVGKLDSLKVRSGMNRVEIVGNTHYLRTATKCEVTYGETSLSFNIDDIVSDDGKARMLIENLEGGSYYFDVATFDKEENSSIHTSVYGVAYGSNDVLKETPKRIANIIPKPNGSVDLEWNDADVTYYTVSWEDADGIMHELKIEDSPEYTNIPSWKKGGKITVNSYVQKSTSDLDMLTLDPIDYAFPEKIAESIPRFGLGSAMDLGAFNDWDMYGAFTIEMRLRYNELAPRDQCVISCEAEPARGFMLRSSGNVLQYYLGENWWNGGTCCSLTIGEWIDVAITYKENNSMALYINGAMVSSRGCGRIADTPMHLQVGTSPCYSDRYMRGDIQHLSIWRDAKTAEQIKADVDAGYGFTGKEDGLKAYWPMTVNYGAEVEDVTGKHTATFKNVTWNAK